MAPSRMAVSTYRRVSRSEGRAVLSEGNDDGGSGRGLIAAIIVIVLLVGGGLWLTGVLRSSANIQDCVAAGRTNCAPIH